MNEKGNLNYDDIIYFFKKIITLLEKDKYIGLKEYEQYTKQYYNFYKNIDKNHKYYKPLNIIYDSNLLKRHNREFLNKKLIELKEYFDDMFKDIDKNILLDDNQRKAIIADEDNLLIVAGAGSGKTTTMAAKVKYLIDKQEVNPKEIAVISFTNKACEEISRRIHKDFGFTDVDVYTFHQLGLKILRGSGKEIVNIADDGSKYKIFSDYIKNVVFNDKDFFEKFINAFADKLYFDDEYKNYNSFKDYHDSYYNRKLINSKFDLKNYNEYEIKKRLERLKTINGEYVKSKEEVLIANFLYENGINYEYEKTYDKKVGENRVYKPDFYITQLDHHNYIEHFGVSEDYQNNKYTKKELENYLNNMKLKISFHNEPDNYQKFIITYSKYNDKKTLIEHLTEELQKFGYQFKKRNDKDIFLRLRDTSEDNYFSKFIDRILIPFISIFKGNNYDENSFKKLKSNIPKELKNKIEIVEQFYLYYQNTLEKQNRIDFEDMINLAYKIMPKLKESNLNVDYNYIIIDEYQDVSIQRYNLTKRISDLFDAKIMAVGDDFQAIFGFAGSDIELFTDFKKYLNNAKMIPIINTYRNSQELVDLASDFVLKNNMQIKKKLIAHKSLKNPVEIFLYDDSKKFLSDYTKPIAVSKIIGDIYNNNSNDTVLLLGRYKDDINTLLKSGLFVKLNRENIRCKNYPNVKIDFLTIHTAKGLGYDQCILINSSNEKFGFPSLIEDEPIIGILKSKTNETIPYPEERRLFYVALTRTKNKIYIVAPSTHISTFITEIKDDKNVLYHDNIVKCYNKISTTYDCPKCNNKLMMFNYKKSDYWLYECEKCHFKTSTPKKAIPIKKCPKCDEIVIYKYTDNKTNDYILKCFNKHCDYSERINKDNIIEEKE